MKALRGEMRVELAKLHKSLDPTMIYVTHDQVEAMTLADRIVVISEGRLEQFGTPMELYHGTKNQVCRWIHRKSKNKFSL
ncbi:MAG: hypothetical protein Ct9H300mP28_25870 [Pseudomonadota bacterium]|nr:MAG: hypothetical protein Ct9H300mP28_25870 [Pseudomonadota bacterium]